MSKFAAIAKGARQRRHDVEFTTLHGAPAKCDLRVLNGDEYESALVAASAKAKAVGAEPAQGNLVFDFELAAETVARAAVDSDVRDKDEAYFESIEEVKAHLDRERILLLFSVQSTLQDECSPRLNHMTLEEAMDAVWEHAVKPEGAELPFERWQPVLQRTWVHFLVGLLATSDAKKSPSTSASASTSSGSSPT